MPRAAAVKSTAARQPRKASCRGTSLSTGETASTADPEMEAAAPAPADVATSAEPAASPQDNVMDDEVEDIGDEEACEAGGVATAGAADLDGEDMEEEEETANDGKDDGECPLEGGSAPVGASVPLPMIQCDPARPVKEEASCLVMTHLAAGLSGCL